MIWKKIALFCFLIFLLFSKNHAQAIENSFSQSNAFSVPEKLILIIEKNHHETNKEEILKWMEINPRLEFSQSQKSEIANIYFCSTDKILCRLTKSAKEQLYIFKKTDIAPKKERLLAFVEDLARQYNQDAIDAKFVIEEERVTIFSPSKEGIKLNIEKSAEIIFNALKTTAQKFPEKQGVNLSWQKIVPQIQEKNINNLGVQTVIGEGKSNFKGSPKNRIFNIKVATARFNGILIKPQEEFSFVNVLGQVDGEHGYLPELVIKKNKTEPEFGGGICQVSTTIFRAAIYSGLKITSRRNHAYPVKYYNPQGMDATIYIPQPDLRFINNTSGHILIQARIENTELIFAFYGTEDGRKIEIDGPKIIERKPDGAMKTTFTQKVFDKEGNKLIEDIFNSAYDSPLKYPHPEEIFTTKPSDWSDKEWKRYKKNIIYKKITLFFD